MIILKTEEEIELMRAANQLVGATLAEIAKVIQPGVSTAQLDRVAEEFIRDHSDENLHVEDVVRHLKVSRRLLFLRFRQITGHTVLDAIRAAQLERVRTLLQTTTLSITGICRLYKFRSENHLKRLFKQAFGQTMSAYRNA